MPDGVCSHESVMALVLALVTMLVSASVWALVGDAGEVVVVAGGVGLWW